MAKYKVTEISDKKLWENFLLSEKPKSFLQSWSWGETHKLMGEKVFRLGMFEGEKLVGVCLLIKQEAKRGPHFLIPAGPIFDWNDKELVSEFFKVLRKLAREEGVWFVRLRAELADNLDNKRRLRKIGFIPAPMHLHAENTWVLDISASDEEILAGMRKTTRYLIRKSLKLDLKMKISSDPKYSIILKRLQDETVGRHKFIGFPQRLFSAQLETFGADNQAVLFLCKKEEQVLAVALVIFYGEYAYYHHSASSSRFRELPVSYFLQWKIIQEAKKRGLRYYNFWGIAPSDDPRHRFSGVTLFKKGFGGERIDWIHAHDLAITPFYWATYLFETTRRIFRRL